MTAVGRFDLLQFEEREDDITEWLGECQEMVVCFFYVILFLSMQLIVIQIFYLGFFFFYPLSSISLSPGWDFFLFGGILLFFLVCFCFMSYDSSTPCM